MAQTDRPTDHPTHRPSKPPRGKDVSLRWRRRKEARPQEILDAAMAVFAEKGYAAARLEDIARRAGVAKGTIYLYFESKEAVFKGLVKATLGSHIDGFAESVRAHDGDSAALLTELLRRIGAFLRSSDYVVLPKIVIAEAGNFPDLARTYREEVAERGLSLIGGVVAKGIARGEFRDMPLGHAVRLAIAPLLLMAIWRTTFAAFDAEPYDYEGLIECHIETLLHGLCVPKEETR